MNSSALDLNNAEFVQIRGRQIQKGGRGREGGGRPIKHFNLRFVLL